jgi:hypothetical protein
MRLFTSTCAAATPRLGYAEFSLDQGWDMDRRRQLYERALSVAVGGLYTLTPPDPFAWFQRKAPGFNPRACEVKNRFQASAAFQMQLAPLRRGAALHRGGALQVESS